MTGLRLGQSVTARKTLKWINRSANKIGTGVKNATATSKGSSQTIGAVVGAGLGAAAKTPFTIGGKILTNVGKNIGTATAVGAQNLGSKITGGAIPAKPMPPKIKQRIATIGTVGGFAMDASLHQPKVDPINDHSGDIWDALQKKY